MPCYTTEDLFIKSDRSPFTQPTANKRKRFRLTCTLIFFCFLCFSETLTAQNIGYYNPEASGRFFFNGGIGFGVANYPVKNTDNSAVKGGITLNASLGYRFNEKFSLGFGPSFWIEGQDVIDNSASNNESPSNKRTLVTLDGFYQPAQKLPLQIRLGAGIGTFVYTPGKNVVSADNNGISKTEITNGFAASAGLIYKVSLGEKISLFPSLNFWYSKLEPQKIKYESLIRHNQASIVTDFRINAFLFF